MNILERMNDVYAGLHATMVGYDPYGYNGRDKHPDHEDIGFAGVILKVVEVDDTLLGDGYDEDDMPCCLLVQAANGRQLELMTHECDISRSFGVRQSTPTQMLVKWLSTRYRSGFRRWRHACPCASQMPRR